MWNKLKKFVISKFFVNQIGLLILFYLVAVFFTLNYLDVSTNHGEKIKVPNLKDLHVDQAKSKLDELNLGYQILDSIYRPELPVGTVLEQLVDPTDSSGVYVKTGRIIGLRLSKKFELVAIPSLINKQVQFAQDILKRRGLNSIIQYRPTTEANGSVMDQLFNGIQITEGTKVPIGSNITLIVGQNDQGKPIAIPNLVELYLSDALIVLDSLGLKNIVINCVNCSSNQDSTGTPISRQTPEFYEGGTIFKATQITITIEAANPNNDVIRPEDD